MAKENEIQEARAPSIEELRAQHNAKLDVIVEKKMARSRRHAQFLVNSGAIKLP